MATTRRATGYPGIPCVIHGSVVASSGVVSRLQEAAFRCQGRECKAGEVAHVDADRIAVLSTLLVVAMSSKTEDRLAGRQWHGLLHMGL